MVGHGSHELFHDVYISTKMSKIIIYCHREVNSKTCTFVSWEHSTPGTMSLNGIIAINFWPDNCKDFQEKLSKRDYCNYRWQKMKMVTLLVESAEKCRNFEIFTSSVFSQNVKRKKNVIRIFKLWGLQASETK